MSHHEFATTSRLARPLLFVVDLESQIVPESQSVAVDVQDMLWFGTATRGIQEPCLHYNGNIGSGGVMFRRLLLGVHSLDRFQHVLQPEQSDSPSHRGQGVPTVPPPRTQRRNTCSASMVHLADACPHGRVQDSPN